MNKIILLLAFTIITINSYGCIRISSDGPDDNLTVIQEKTFPISEGKLFRISTRSGKINISSWDKNEVYIKVLGNEETKDKMTFTFKNSTDVVEVLAKSKSSFLGISIHNFRLTYEIKIPKNFNTEGKTSGGDIYIENINGNQHLKTSGGNVNARNLTGLFESSTSGGDFRIDNLSGKINISTSGGNINAKQFTGDFVASTSGGDVSLISKDAKIDASTSGGNISLQYTGENKGIELSTSGGNIEIELPKEFSASAKLETSGGDIEVDFKGNNAVKISKTKYQADLNNGGNPLRVETSGGNITVKSK